MQPQLPRAPVTVRVDFSGEDLTALNHLTAQIGRHQDEVIRFAVTTVRNEIGSEPLRREAYERQAREQRKRTTYAALIGLGVGAVIVLIVCILLP